MPLNGTGTASAGVNVLVVLIPFCEALRLRALADKSVTVETRKKMPISKNGKPAKMRADVEWEMDFILKRSG